VLRFDDEAMSAATCRFLQRGRAVRAPIAGGGNGYCVVVSAECFRYVPRAFRSRISPPITRMLGRPKLVLASGSPRRLGLLNQAGIEPDALRPADVDETPKRGELPRACANRLARAKADAALKSVHLDDELRGSFILAADTVVAVGRRILPKANLVDEASQCLRLLSGRNHRVYTAICLVTPREAFRQRLIETRVRFKRLSEDDIQAYIGSGEWRGKAGGYAVQGIAGSFVVKMVGSYTNIVGLPLYETVTLLGGEGFPVRFGWLNAS
jgi:septum formation protein